MEKEDFIMRILLKILLFPITFILTILLSICEFLTIFSSMLLSIVAMIFFVLGIGSILLLRETKDGIFAIVLAYLVSPYGIPMFAAWLIGILQAANERLKSI